MTPVIPLYPLSREELLEELRGKENSLLDDEQDFLRIAEAVWRLISRLLVENDVLRGRH